MEIGTVVTTATVAYVAGIATDWWRGWSVSWFSNREIRRAIQAEFHAVLVTLNFYILNAMEENGRAAGLIARYFPRPLQLEAFQYYWQHQQHRLLRLPEWSRLKSWNDNLGQIGFGAPHPPLFMAIMLFESLTIPPLDRCVSRDSRKFVRNVLARPEVAKYKLDYLLRESRPS
jgi:hypothetical protein